MKSLLSMRPWHMIVVCILTTIALGLFVNKTICAIYIIASLCSAFLWRKKYIEAVNASKHIRKHDTSANMED